MARFNVCLALMALANTETSDAKPKLLDEAEALMAHGWGIAKGFWDDNTMSKEAIGKIKEGLSEKIQKVSDEVD